MDRTVRILLITILVLLGIVVLVMASGVFRRQDTWQAVRNELPVISTRGHFLEGKLADGMDAYSYELQMPEGQGDFWESQPADLIVIIHGFNNNEAKASIKFRTAELSLRSNGFAGAVVGFSWDANTQKDPFGTTGYREGREHARGNGAKLARFVADCRERLPGTRIHLIGYSMGARLALEALLAMQEDGQWKDSALSVDSVHLVGAAIDNEEVELRERYGRAIERHCGLLVNYFSPEDNALGIFFPLKEGDRALGESDIEHPEDAPANYLSIDIADELIDYDDQLLADPEHGDNHSGCLGNLGTDGALLDDGIMDVVLEQIMLLENDTQAATGAEIDQPRGQV